jgi:hypothetical protein
VHYLDSGVTVALQTNTDRDIDLFDPIAQIAKALPASD